MHATHPETHKKVRGRIHDCEYCGEPIAIGEVYESWVSFDEGQRYTVYMHKECATELGKVMPCGGELPPKGDNKRPPK